MLVDVKTHSCVDIMISNYKFRISVMGGGQSLIQVTDKPASALVFLCVYGNFR